MDSVEIGRYSYKGILISILFLVVFVILGRLGIDLGQILWISLAAFLAVAVIYGTARTASRIHRGPRRPPDT